MRSAGRNVTRSVRLPATISVLALSTALAVSGCGAEASEGASSELSPEPSPGPAAAQEGVERAEAEQVMQVSEVHDETGMTLLEGPTFDSEGMLHLVDVTAPPGGPKVLEVDLDAEEVATTYSDDEGAFTSAQFSPADGRMHLTDYRTGRILSMTADGEDVRTEFEGKVGDRAMSPDDIAFGPDGSMYITDSSPTSYPEGGHDGRVVRVDPETGAADVLASGLPNPNGISLSGDGRELWVGMLDGARIDRLLLDASGTEVETGHAAVHISGGDAQPDSSAIDADGNIYQAMHGRPEIRVYSPDGEHVRTIRVPAEDGDLESATNLAIRPGTTESYATVSGSSGGFLYRFEASAEGVRASNGG